MDVRVENLSFLEGLVRFETSLWNEVDRALASAGAASLATLLTLRHLKECDGRGRVQDIAVHLGVTVGAASKIVDRLERQELVARRPHPDDRRSALISLTDQGSQKLTESSMVAEAALARLLPPDSRTNQVADIIHSLSEELRERREEIH